MAEGETVRATLERVFDTVEAQTPTPEPPAPREGPPTPRREAPPAKEPPPEPPANGQDIEPEPEPDISAPRERSVDRPRDQFGRFARSSPQEQQPPTAAAQAELPLTDQPTEAAPEPEAPAIQAPQSWSASARDTFSTLPRAAQEEIQKRERDVERGFAERAQQINTLQPIAQALQPYQNKFALKGVNPAAAVQQLLAVQDLLERDPIEGVAYVARSYGVDLRQFAHAFQQSQQPQDPQVREANTRIDRVEGLLRSWQQNAEQQQTQQIQAEVQAFEANAEAHPHFAAVRGKMAELMANNMATTLEDAYRQACRLDDSVYKQIEDSERRQAAVNRAKAEKDAAAQARRAAVSVSSAPGSGTGNRGKANGSLRTQLERNFDRLATR